MNFSAELEERLEKILVLGNVAEGQFGKVFWVKRLQAMPPEHGEQVIALFELFPNEIEWLGKIQLQKEEALAKNDQDAWQNIVDEEAKHIASLVSNQKIV